MLRRDVLGQWIVGRVEALFGFAPGTIATPGKGAMEVSEARGRAGYVLHTVCGLSLSDTARCLRQHRSTIATAVARVESGRDDPVLDAHINHLEAEVRPLMHVIDSVLEQGA